MSKISELSDGGALQSTDYLIAVRSGGNVKVQPAGMTFSSVTITSSDINGGNIDGTIIGAATPAAGSFTTGQFGTSLNVDGTVTADGLTVATSSAVTAQLGRDGSDGDVLQIYNGAIGSTKALALGVDGTSGTIESQFGNIDIKPGSALAAKFASGGDISFYEDTGTTPKFFWDASAEALGIGTNLPIGSFTVADSGTPVASPASLATIHSSTSSKYFLKLTSADFNANGNWVGLGLGYSSSYLKSAIISEAKDAYGRANLHFALNSATSSDSASLSDSRMVIDYNGNVGIGNTSPNAKFTNYKNTSISGSAGATLSLEDDSQPRMMMVADSSTSYISSFNSNPITFSVTAGNFSSSTGTERMRIDSSGNLLVGTTTASGKLTIAGSGANRAAFAGPTGTLFVGYDGANDALQVASNSYVVFQTGGSYSERARIDSSGNLLVGTTSGFGGLINVPVTTSDEAMVTQSDSTSSSIHLNFRNPNGFVGSISTNGSITAYNISSDARLKENIADAEDASSLVDAIKVRQFDWKADGSHQRYGMVAQELMTVAPEAVSGDPESDDMMGVDYSKLVPMLVKEIQSLRARVAQLEGV